MPKCMPEVCAASGTSNSWGLELGHPFDDGHPLIALARSYVADLPRALEVIKDRGSGSRCVGGGARLQLLPAQSIDRLNPQRHRACKCWTALRLDAGTAADHSCRRLR